MPERHATVRADIDLAWWEWPGSMPPTMLMHGIGNYARYWDLLADAVGGRLRLIASDARGHGESGKPSEAEAYAADEFVADALEIMGAAGIQSALVVGHSMGGGHAARLAASHPGRVRGLVLVDWSPAPLAEGAERARRLSLSRPAAVVDEADALAYLRETSPGHPEAVYANRLAYAFTRGPDGLTWKSSPAALAAILGGRAAASSEDPAAPTPSSDQKRVPPDVGGRGRSASARGRSDAYRRGARGRAPVIDGRRGPDLGVIACPVLVVRGTRSTVLSAEVAGATARELRNGRILELDAGHNVALDRPRELAAAIVDFSASLRP